MLIWYIQFIRLFYFKVTDRFMFKEEHMLSYITDVFSTLKSGACGSSDASCKASFVFRSTVLSFLTVFLTLELSSISLVGITSEKAVVIFEILSVIGLWTATYKMILARKILFSYALKFVSISLTVWLLIRFIHYLLHSKVIFMFLMLLLSVLLLAYAVYSVNKSIFKLSWWLTYFTLYLFFLFKYDHIFLAVTYDLSSSVKFEVLLFALIGLNKCYVFLSMFLSDFLISKKLTVGKYLRNSCEFLIFLSFLISAIAAVAGVVDYSILHVSKYHNDFIDILLLSYLMLSICTFLIGNKFYRLYTNPTLKGIFYSIVYLLIYMYLLFYFISFLSDAVLPKIFIYIYLLCHIYYTQ